MLFWLRKDKLKVFLLFHLITYLIKIMKNQVPIIINLIKEKYNHVPLSIPYVTTYMMNKYSIMSLLDEPILKQ